MSRPLEYIETEELVLAMYGSWDELDEAMHRMGTDSDECRCELCGDLVQ